jgi:hypothetical protein
VKLVALNSRPGCRFWRNNVGSLEWAPGKRLNYGLGVGSADLIGIVSGRFVALEVKRPGEKQSVDQVRWGKCVGDCGGAYAVVHSVAEALEYVGWVEQRRLVP